MLIILVALPFNYINIVIFLKLFSQYCNYCLWLHLVSVKKFTKMALLFLAHEWSKPKLLGPSYTMPARSATIPHSKLVWTLQVYTLLLYFLEWELRLCTSKNGSPDSLRLFLTVMWRRLVGFLKVIGHGLRKRLR